MIPHNVELAAPRPITALGAVGAAWGFLGVNALVLSAIWRLTPLAFEPVADGTMSAWQWLLYLGFLGFNLYAEGYRGFQRAFSPRLAARAVGLARQPTPLLVMLAPLYCMALMHARRRRLIISRLMLVAIVGLVVAVHHLDQPWRGIVDAGVVGGLIWGWVTIWTSSIAALRGDVADPELPESDDA